MRRDLHLRVLRDRRPRRVPRRDVVRLPTPTGATVMNIDEAIRIALLETALEVALERRDAALAEAEQSRAELRRYQAAVRAIRDIHVNNGAPDGAWGVCCGQAWPCETADALREVPDA